MLMLDYSALKAPLKLHLGCLEGHSIEKLIGTYQHPFIFMYHNVSYIYIYIGIDICIFLSLYYINIVILGKPRYQPVSIRGDSTQTVFVRTCVPSTVRGDAPQFDLFVNEPTFDIT